MYLDALLPDMAFTPGDIPMLGRLTSCRPARSSASPARRSRDPRRSQSPPDRVPLGHAVHLPRQGGSQDRDREVPEAVVVEAQGPLDAAQGGGDEAGERVRRQRRREQGRRRGRGAPGARRRPRRLRVPHGDGHGLGPGPRSRPAARSRRSSRSSRRGASSSGTRRSMAARRGSARSPGTSTRTSAGRSSARSTSRTSCRSRPSGRATRENEHLRRCAGVGAAPRLLQHVGATPFRLNLDVDDVGHTLIVGPTGAGKSTLLSLRSRSSGSDTRARRSIIFDKDRSARAPRRSRSAAHLRARERESADRVPAARANRRSRRAALGVAVRPEPARRAARRGDAGAQARRRQALAADRDGAARAADALGLTVHLATWLSRPRCARTRSRATTVRSSTPTTSDLGGGSWQMFEMGHLMALGEEVDRPRARLPLSSRRGGASTAGRRSWSSTRRGSSSRHPIFVRRLQAWLKTLRKKNVYVVFATQEVADAAQSRSPRRSSRPATRRSTCPTRRR